MERMRHCGFLSDEEDISSTPVWVRNDLILFECPKSYVSASSLGFLESYAVWKRHRGIYDAGWDARDTDAFTVLANEVSEEEKRNASRVERVDEQRRLRR